MGSLINRNELRRLEKAARDKDKNKLVELYEILSGRIES